MALKRMVTDMARKIFLVEVTVDVDDYAYLESEVDVWVAIGNALTDAGFDDVLYGECLPLFEEE